MVCRAKVNTGLLLRAVCDLTKVGVNVECVWSYSARGGSAPRAIVIKAGQGMIIGGDTLGKFTKNGYRFQNMKADGSGLVLHFEREYA